MKGVKTKSRSKIKRVPSAKKSDVHIAYSKPALRSDAFARALVDAKMCLNNSETLEELFNDAAKKAAVVPKEAFKEYWPYLQTMLRLVRAHHRREYTQVPDNALLWIVAALSYLIDPFDLIPDKTPFLGFVDDATVVEFVADRTRQTLDDFMTWETTATAGP
ncbi:MAG: YkvA family protein [Candidatus Udaeobacter sp.]